MVGLQIALILAIDLTLNLKNYEAMLPESRVLLTAADKRLLSVSSDLKMLHISLRHEGYGAIMFHNQAVLGFVSV